MTVESKSLYYVFEQACKATGKWGLMLSAGGFDSIKDDPRELKSAAPYLSVDDVAMLWSGDTVFRLYDSETEARADFRQTVGDEGPTATNSYSGKISVFAALASPVVGIVTENT